MAWGGGIYWRMNDFVQGRHMDFLAPDLSLQVPELDPELLTMILILPRLLLMILISDHHHCTAIKPGDKRQNKDSTICIGS